MPRHAQQVREPRPDATALPTRHAFGLLLGSSLALASCGSHTVEIPDPNIESVAPGGGSSDDGLGVDGDGVPNETTECAPGRLPRRAVWLSDIQFANTIATLFGDAAVDPERAPDAALKPFSQKGAVVNTSLLRARLDLAGTAAASLTGRIGEVTGCADGDDECARDFVADLAERAFRRPVGDGELSDLGDVYDVGRETDFETAVKLSVEAIVASPSFSYRTEFGAGSGVTSLTDHEMASLLSYWLTDGPPDAELLAAADAGQLRDEGALEAQVGRLLDTPAAQDSITLTMMSAWGMSNVFGAAKDPTLFPDYGPLLQSNMFEETRLFLNEALWGSSGSLGEVLTSRRSFVNQALADLYGVPFTGNDPTEFAPVELPADERSGFLTQASLLTARARTDNTSVVARGLFVRAALMCLPRPPPPPESVLQQVEELLAADMTERERAQVRATTNPCNGCHATFDGFGLMLENYDAVGRFREELDGEPIDASVELDQLGFPGQFENALEFSATAAEDPQFTACVARHLAVYATGDDAVAAGDCELGGFAETAPVDANMRDLVAFLARSTLLSTRSGE